MKRIYTRETNRTLNENLQSFQYNVLSFPNSLINGRLTSYQLKKDRVEAKLTATNGAGAEYTAIFALTDKEFTLVITSNQMTKDNFNRLCDYYIKDLEKAEFWN